MTYDEQSGDYTLSSGRRFSSFTTVIGLAAPVTEAIGWHVWAGAVRVGGNPAIEGSDPRWTSEERAELADEMIRRWTAFKASVPAAALDGTDGKIPQYESVTPTT